MYITKEELDQRLKKTSLIVTEKERKERKKVEEGKEEESGEKRLTHEERVMIGTLAAFDEQKAVAELLGVSQQTVSNVSRGITSPTLGVDQELKEDIEKNIGEIGKNRLENEKKIQEQLVTNLAAALGHVANNLGHTDATEASKIAVDMSKILDRVSPSNREHRGGNRTAIIINVPTMKEEHAYKTISVE